MSIRKAVAVVAAMGSLSLVPVVAGSASAAPSGGCPYPPGHRPSLSLTVTPSPVRAASTVSVFGKFTQNNCGVKGASVVLQRRAYVSGKPSGSWSTFSTQTTDSNGLYSTTRKPTRDEQVRAVFTASGGFASATSSVVLENVRTYVPMSATILSGCRLQVVGGTTPVKAGRTVYVQGRSARNSKFTGWTNLWSTKTGRKGHFATTHTLTCGKTYNFAVYIGSDSTNLANRSRTIFGAKMHH
jgi:hypothetical protein